MTDHEHIKCRGCTDGLAPSPHCEICHEHIVLTENGRWVTVSDAQRERVREFLEEKQ